MMYLKDIWPTILGTAIILFVIFTALFGTTSALYFFFYEGMVEKTITKMVEVGSLR